ncbi:trigger factor [Hugenholtzia roseola]|uniref:trigger factor n=1 Tax=Hugenholtzia roseola TaxID=1002 RepID=UPI000425491E|nr:trigger factor [Hugenholtzia roseola]
MEIVLEKKDNCYGLIKVSVAVEDYKADFEKKLKEYRAKASFKGFRPGQAPMSFVKKMIGKGVKADLIQEQLDQTLNNFIAQEKLEIVGQILPLQDLTQADLLSEVGYELIYEIGFVPTFSYQTNFDITAYDIEIDDTFLQEYIENLQNRFGETSEPEVSAAGDFLYGTIKSKTTSFEVDTLVPLKQIEAAELDKFVGVKAGDTITFEMKRIFSDAKKTALALGIEEEAAAALEGEFTMTVNSLTRTRPAELNKTFFAQVFGLQTKEQLETSGAPQEEIEAFVEDERILSEEAFKKGLRKNLLKEMDKETNTLLEYQLREKLLENTTIELPREFLEKWIKHISPELSPDTIKKDYPNFEKSLKWTLIKKAILRDKDVKVQREDILEILKDQLRQYLGSMAQTFDEQLLDNLAERILREKKGNEYEEIVQEAIDKKALTLLKKEVNIQTEAISRDAFSQMVKELNKSLQQNDATDVEA